MSERLTLPVLPLRDFVLFPGVTTPINVGKPMTLRAIEAALATPERFVFAVSQREETPPDQHVADPRGDRALARARQSGEPQHRGRRLRSAHSPMMKLGFRRSGLLYVSGDGRSPFRPDWRKTQSPAATSHSIVGPSRG